jgi:ribose-phosphate pyrophosphokinase
VVITDTIAQSEAVKACPKIREVSVATLIGEAIRRIANDESVSKLFD